MLKIEDSSARVKLNLDSTRSDGQSYFTEGNIVIAEGNYKSGTFYVDYIVHPPMKFKLSTDEILHNDSFGAYTYVKNKILNQTNSMFVSALDSSLDQSKIESHKIDENEGIVVISNLSLDEPSSMKSLEQIFEAYEATPFVSTIILCGEFISNKKVDTLDFDSIKFNFEELAELIKKYQRLRTE